LCHSFDGSLGNLDTIGYIDHIIRDTNSGIEKPAAIIVETVQAEGGINLASAEWLAALANLCTQHDILLICDDIQVGCGRTGPFFSFEKASIKPDIVVLSKSISGYGLPISLLLLKPELDIWPPGEHNGTFRGNQLACIAARCTRMERCRQSGGAGSAKRAKHSGLPRNRNKTDSSVH